MGGGGGLEAPEEELTFIMTAALILILTVSVQSRRNDRLQSFVGGYLQGLLPQNSQL